MLAAVWSSPWIAWSRRAALLALLVMLGSCSSGKQPPAVKTAGAGTAAAGSTSMNLIVDGVARTVMVHVPTGYAGTHPVPLVLNLHGSGSTAAQQEELTRMDATADAHGFVVAYPQAAIAADLPGGGFDWNVPGVPLLGGKPVPAGSGDDIAFLAALPRTLAAGLCLDLHRVYATGLSGGGRISGQLACDAAGEFGAVAPVAGLRLPDPCPSRHAVPVLAFHGTADPIDPYNGNGQAYWTYSVPEAARRWAAHDGCAGTGSLSTPAASATLTIYQPCQGDAVVELYTLAGAGHIWPGGPPLPAAAQKLLGPPSAAVNANEAIWTFFVAHPLP